MTVYNASKMAAGVTPKALYSAGGVNLLSTIALTVALVANDTINFCNLQGDPGISQGSAYGPTIIGMLLDCDPLDTSTGLTLDVGDSGAAQRYYKAVTTGQSAQTPYATPNVNGTLGYAPFTSLYGTYTTISNLLYTIVMTCHHAATTWQNGTVRLLVEYTYDV